MPNKKVVLTFEPAEVYGKPIEELMISLFDKSKAPADVAFNGLGVNRQGLDSYLAAPFWMALEGKGHATIDVIDPAKTSS